MTSATEASPTIAWASSGWAQAVQILVHSVQVPFLLGVACCLNFSGSIQLDHACTTGSSNSGNCAKPSPFLDRPALGDLVVAATHVLDELPCGVAPGVVLCGLRRQA